MDKRGRITVPKDARERLGLRAGAVLSWQVEGNRLVLTGGERSQLSGEKLVERMRGSATTRMSTDEILQLTRG
jgi:AbrB family looped-hinge helix DNA binding protein